jgi:hypothetical protein
MLKTNYFKESLVISILMSGVFTVANAAPEGVWTGVGTYGYGAATIRTINGGEWVYKNQLQRPSSSPLVVLLGPRAQADEVQFFSSQEEKALWDMEQKTINDEAVAITKTNVHRYAKPRAWPKVVLTDTEICVPHLQYATADDWKSHLVCTPKAQ